VIVLSIKHQSCFSQDPPFSNETAHRRTHLARQTDHFCDEVNYAGSQPSQLSSGPGGFFPETSIADVLVTLPLKMSAAASLAPR
jgi:hypothetical protein